MTAHKGRSKHRKSARYNPPRIVQSWIAPMRSYVSCLATAAFDDGLRGAALVEAVSSIVPRWRSLFETPPTDTALISRAHKSRRGPTSETEAPEVNMYKKAIWPIAKRDHNSGKRTFYPGAVKKVA